jgi:hypothetical protein
MRVCICSFKLHVVFVFISARLVPRAVEHFGAAVFFADSLAVAVQLRGAVAVVAHATVEVWACLQCGVTAALCTHPKVSRAANFGVSAMLADSIVSGAAEFGASSMLANLEACAG